MSRLTKAVRNFLGHRPSLKAHPALNPDVVGFLEGVLLCRPDARVLEFGSGSSTIWFADRAGHITSFEHDPLWFDVVGAESAKRLNVDHRLLTRPYSEHLADLPDESFDLVLVDGRDRVRCALAAIRTLKPGGLMVVDNIDREYYAPISTALAAWRRLDFPTGAPHTSAWVKPQSASFRTVPLTHGR